MDNLHRSFIFCLLILSILLIFSNNGYQQGITTSLAEEDDIRCLQEVKSSLNDPQSKLSSWTFTNTSKGFICSFAGVSCLNKDKNRVIGLDLREFGVSGNILESLRFCHSLQSLQLSGISLSGEIPPQICDWLPNLTNLDLSNNSLTGQIPEGLANCSYLNTLVLDDNKLSGSVPYQITSLRKLRRFSVANNELRGTVRPFDYPVDVNYNGNLLCNGFTEQMRWFYWWIEQVHSNNSYGSYNNSGWNSEKGLNELVRDYIRSNMVRAKKRQHKLS